MISRRQLLRMAGALPFAVWLPQAAQAQQSPDWTRLKAGYAQRLQKILAAGELPYIDIESSCNSGRLDIDALAASMDRLNIGLMALSADIGRGQFDAGVRFDRLSDRLLAAYPDRFIPVGNGGQPPALTEAGDEFLDAQEAAARSRQVMLLGEYEFRHYASPRQAKRGELGRDVDIALDGPLGQRVFRIAAQTGLPVQIHYEVEDGLMPALERMLTQYPQAKVIWCHLAQVRYAERAPGYTAACVAALIGRFPNLYFDTAFGDSTSIYPLSNQRHAHVWATDGSLAKDWRELIVAYPTHFLSALDLGGDRVHRIAEFDSRHRDFLKRLPATTQHRVAYRNAWSLLFGEEFDAS